MLTCKGYATRLIQHVESFHNFFDCLKNKDITAVTKHLPLINGALLPMQGPPPCDVKTRIQEQILRQTYQRCATPNAKELSKYASFSSEVYGELMPPLIYEFIVTAGITSHSLVLDLGSGVGNIVTQIGLLTGCRTYGIEIRSTPADVATKMVIETSRRCQLWGLDTPPTVELENGDMLKSARVSELVSKADVVIVNNKLFEVDRK
jgi:H3 lysine-79-specific histone-lysine N-methyltransferase